MTSTQIGGICGDTWPAPAGVDNQAHEAGPLWPTDEPACPEKTTHTLNGKPLCEKHWKQGLKARTATDARMRGYSNRLRNYQR